MNGDAEANGQGASKDVRVKPGAMPLADNDTLPRPQPTCFLQVQVVIETARADELEPYQYLGQVFTALPQAETVEDFENLLPWAFKKTPAD